MDSSIIQFSSEEHVINHDLQGMLGVIAKIKSTARWKKSILYSKLGSTVDGVTLSGERADYGEDSREISPYLRAVSWNIDQGMYYEGILDVLHHNRLINNADIYLLPAVDLGMPRSNLRNVARDLALELGCHYVFQTCYLNLEQANQVNEDLKRGGKKNLNLEGCAIISRFPIRDVKAICLPTLCDPMKMREKRLGCQKALVVEILWGTQSLRVVCVHLDRYSSPRYRAFQFSYLLRKLTEMFPGEPVLIAGDLQTTTFNTSSSLSLTLSFLNKVFRGVDFIVQEHLPYPENYFDRHIFSAMRKFGFSVDGFNEIGKGTVHFKLDDKERFKTLASVLSPVFMRRLAKTLNVVGGKANLKLDWFVGNSLLRPSKHSQAEKPKVVSNLYYNGVPASTHDAIMLDFEIERSQNEF